MKIGRIEIKLLKKKSYKQKTADNLNMLQSGIDKNAAAIREIVRILDAITKK